MSSFATNLIPIAAASAAIVPVFGDLIAKSEQQQGRPVSQMSRNVIFREAIKAAPTVGVIVGTQMIIQPRIERLLFKDSTPSFTTTLASSALVGMISAPVLAVFNGQTMGWSVVASLKRFSFRQGAAITVQESVFVAGIASADKVAVVMRRYCGENKAVDYAAAFTAGAAGSLAGHPANTILTRWQAGLPVEGKHLMLGAARKARAIGFFSVFYKFGKENLQDYFK